MWIVLLIGIAAIVALRNPGAHLSGTRVQGTEKYNGVTLDQIAANMVTMSKIGTPQTIADAAAGLKQLSEAHRVYVIRKIQWEVDDKWLTAVTLGS